MIYALVPARGGSKSIYLKNIKEINGRPLIWWVLNAASASVVDRIFVATDSDNIKDVVEGFGFDKVEVIGRSPYTAADHSKTELVMEEFCKNYEFETLILLQPTSPMVRPEWIDVAVELLKTGDTVLPVVNSKKFIWKEVGGKWVNRNFDMRNRPMRQDFDGFFVENGYIYAMGREAFLLDGCRLHGKIIPMEFPEYTLFEPDEPSDWGIVESLLERYGYIL